MVFFATLSGAAEPGRRCAATDFPAVVNPKIVNSLSGRKFPAPFRRLPAFVLRGSVLLDIRQKGWTIRSSLFIRLAAKPGPTCPAPRPNATKPMSFCCV